MLRKRLVSTNRDSAEHTLARTARIAYPVYLLVVVALFVVVFD
jgi:hypothetical protein